MFFLCFFPFFLEINTLLYIIYYLEIFSALFSVLLSFQEYFYLWFIILQFLYFLLLFTEFLLVSDFLLEIFLDVTCIVSVVVGFSLITLLVPETLCPV